MSRRRKTSGGQALVLVTLGLLAMVGLMGLVVDLGYSFYLKKAAQAAADAGALAAVEEAKSRMGGAFSGFSCPGSPTAATPWCQPAQALCSAVTNTGNNLYNGCLYVASNGFSSGGAGGRQQVSIQADVPTHAMPTTLTGTYSTTSMAYWVTVRASQTVPQLFSAILGNMTGTISASATAAVISTVVPGQFIALNMPGNCIQVKNKTECGVDIDLQGSTMLSAPGGIMMSSTCSATVAMPGCGNSATGSGTTDVGMQQGGGGCVTTASSCGGTANSSIYKQSGSSTSGNFSPTPIVSSGSMFQDPLMGEAQPPLLPNLAPNSVVPTCGIPSGSINGGSANSPLVLGPFQYYSYHTNAGKNILDGNPINITGSVTFSATGACAAGQSVPGLPSGTNIQSSSGFPGYLFYGGMTMGSNVNANFGPGQYVMVGTMSSNGGTVFDTGNGGPNLTGDSTTGTMFIFTAPGYPGLSTQMAPLVTAGLPTLVQGEVDLKLGNSSQVSLNGLSQTSSSLPSGLDQYNGILFWQDRRNSTSDYNTNSNGVPTSITTPGVNGPANGVTPTSPEFNFNANANFRGFNGVIYQPQGAWINISNNPNVNSALQIITGAIVGTGGGNVTLLPTTNPTIKYITALIQ